MGNDQSKTVRKKFQEGGNTCGYSWEKGKKNYKMWKRNIEELDKNDFIISKKCGETLFKEPGSIGGQQFVIEDCKDCDIFLFDTSACVTIDDCKNCRIFIGPVSGSVFIRTTDDCKFVIACQQFRTRQCHNLDIKLYVQTRPIIEDSTGLKFGCFDYFIFGLKDQFDAAELSVFNNEWSNLYDFTPKPKNYEYMDPNIRSYELLKPLHQICPSITAEEEEQHKEMLLVPRTIGKSDHKHEGESSFIIFFAGHGDEAFQFLLLISTQHKEIGISRTREWIFSKADCDMMFCNVREWGSTKALNNMKQKSQKGPVICIHLVGNNAMKVSKHVASIVTSDTTCYAIPTTPGEINHMTKYVFETLEAHNIS